MCVKPVSRQAGRNNWWHEVPRKKTCEQSFEVLDKDGSETTDQGRKRPGSIGLVLTCFGAGHKDGNGGRVSPVPIGATHPDGDIPEGHQKKQEHATA